MKAKGFIITTLVIMNLIFSQATKAVEIKPATLAIIDTPVNASLPELKNNIVHEVCVLDWKTCPNGTQFQEGAGSAFIPVKFMMKEGLSHGTNMAYAAAKTNPSVNIVYVQFAGATSTGSRQITNESSFVNAFTWVLKNKDRFNIKAVALSQSHHNLGNSAEYCPSTPATFKVISDLNAVGVAVFAAAGNNRDLKRVSWPACSKGTLVISATSYGDGPAIYTDFDPNKTFLFARGDMKLLFPDGSLLNQVGSSISAQVAASAYIALANAHPDYTKDQLVALLKTKTMPLVSRTIKNQVVLDVAAALKG